MLAPGQETNMCNTASIGCASNRFDTRARLPGKNSPREHDPSKNQPNRLRFGPRERDSKLLLDRAFHWLFPAQARVLPRGRRGLRLAPRQRDRRRDAVEPAGADGDRLPEPGLGRRRRRRAPLLRRQALEAAQARPPRRARGVAGGGHGRRLRLVPRPRGAAGRRSAGDTR